MLRNFILLFKHSYGLFIAITLVVGALMIASATFGVLFTVQSLNASLEQQNEQEIAVTYFNLEKLDSIKDKLQ